MNLRSIYEHLDMDARRILADAAQETAGASCVGITIERFLLCALRDRSCGAEVMQALDSAGVEAPAVESALSKLVSDEPRASSNGVQPAFTESLRTLLRDAWTLSVDEYGDETVTPVRLFETLARRGDQWPRLVGLLPGFRRVDVAVLAQHARGVPGSRGARAGAAAPDEALERFGYDIGALAREGKLEPVVGMHAAMRSAAAILLRREQSSAVIVGEAGVGKSACARGLVTAIACEEAPAPRALHGVQIWALDTAALRAGASMRGALEERLQGIARALDGSDTLLFVDDLHMLIDASGGAGVDGLRAMLSKNTVRLLATCGWREWRRHIESDPALARRLAPVRLSEPDDEGTETIIEGLKPGLESHHGVAIAPCALSSAVSLSRRYIVARRLPDKAVAALDSACARARMDDDSREGCVPEVGEEQVASVVADLTGIPVGSILTDAGRTASTLEAVLRERVAGQDAALSRCATQARAYLAGLSDRRRPVGALMLCGPSGTGKTETAHALADALFGGRLVNVNMSEYQEAHSVSGLKGAPAGYVGYGEGGRLTEAVRRTPYAVVLLDEIEKAHGDVIEMLYQVLDKGWMEDAEGLEADFSNALLILTTNAGDTVVEAADRADTRPGADAMHSKLNEALSQFFPAAFLGRVQLIPYWPLGDETLAQIAQMRLERLAQSYARSHSSRLDFHESVRTWLASRVRSTPQGARFLDGIIARSIRPAIADYVLGALSADVRPGDVEVAMEDGQLQVREPGGEYSGRVSDEEDTEPETCCEPHDA